MNKKALIVKFGGSSLATVEKIKAAASRVALLTQQYRCAVVVSAMGDETDIMLEQAASLSPHKHLREYDMLLATGEQKSMALMAMALQEQGVRACSLTGWQAKIQTTPQHAHARIDHIDTRIIEQCWQHEGVPVIAGFQGVCEGEITTLGRGGSDLTAVALAAALNAHECQIYTDVDGVYSADPRLVPEAIKWGEISYDMMLELASVGAQVLHNRAVELACKMHVNLRVLSSFVEGVGTMVTHNIKKTSTISGVASQAGMAVFSVSYSRDEVYRYAILSLLNCYKVSLGSVHVSAYQANCGLISFALPAENVEKLQIALKECLGENLKNLEVHPHQMQISIVGVGVQSSERVFLQVHEWLVTNHLPIKLMTSSEVRFSFYVDEDVGRRAVRELHALFHLQYLELKDF